ncbi:hypothetical protein BaRGS_00025011 [Batillaria attramentaria]|uniref:Gasdermin pore forming domain-containing protein n=1 Tax=Batillaria attramentaria TaxID=370345 RepID=A0ABD0K9N2_9CAEN
MFTATTYQVVKSLGKDTLTPVTSVDVADNIRPFSLVLKERRRRLIFWKRCRYLTTEFTLDRILTEPLSDDEKARLVQSRELATFSYETDFSLDGKFGVDLNKELLDVDVDGSDSVTVTSSLGELTKEEVNLPEFLILTRGRQLSLKHELVAPLQADSGKTLCLVTGVVRLKNAAKLTGQVKQKASEEVKVLKEADEEGSVMESRSKTLELPAGTALAYTVYELQVQSKDGQFTLILDRSKRGGFVSSLSVDLDELDGPPPSDAMEATTLFQGILTMSDEERESFRATVLKLLKVPKCLDPLNDLLHKAADFLEMNIEKTATMQSLRNKIPCLDEDMLHILHLAGFEIQEDGTVCYPTATTERFESCELLINLLSDLDDDLLAGLAMCMEDVTTSFAVVDMLRPVWENNEMEIIIEGEQEWLFTETGKKLSESFGIVIDSGVLKILKESLLDVQALYLILAALYVG